MDKTPVGKEGDLMVRLPPSRTAVQRLRAVDEVEVQARLAFVKERLEIRIHEIDRSAFPVRDAADGEDRAEEDSVVGRAGETVAVGEFGLVTITGSSGLDRPGQPDRAEEIAARDGESRIALETERLLATGKAGDDFPGGRGDDVFVKWMPRPRPAKAHHNPRRGGDPVCHAVIPGELERVPRSGRRRGRHRVRRRGRWEIHRGLTRADTHRWVVTSADTVLIVELDVSPVDA